MNTGPIPDALSRSVGPAGQMGPHGHAPLVWRRKQRLRAEAGNWVQQPPVAVSLSAGIPKLLYTGNSALAIVTFVLDVTGALTVWLCTSSADASAAVPRSWNQTKALAGSEFISQFRLSYQVDGALAQADCWAVSDTGGGSVNISVLRWNYYG